VKARLVRFGEIEIAGHAYDHDVVIDKGEVRKRKKKNSKPYQAQYGHTPLSAEEDIPWGGKSLIIGTGLYGRLPVMPEVIAEGQQRGIEVIAVPIEEACRILSKQESGTAHAILHVTC
jgi:hypothetical protein